jgi:chromosome transmission fidelity protein 1
MKSPILQIIQLLKVFSTPYYDGRIMLTIEPNRSHLKFILLNPSICFTEILLSARSVILAGGTMKPLSDFEQLIEDKNRIEYFSCGHVIPKENLVALGLANGPNGIKFDFSFNSRDNPVIVIYLFFNITFIIIILNIKA